MSTETTATTDLHPIFAECLGEVSDIDLSRPFAIGGRVYATDGRVCVRTVAATAKTLRLHALTSERPAPPAASLNWPAAVDAGDLMVLPDVGDGRLACEVCGGTGDWPEFGDEELDNAGEACPDCDGDGWYPDPTGEHVGPLILARRYIALLRRHGVTHVWPVEQPPLAKRKESRPAAYFVGDGFEGLVMVKDRV